MNVIGHGRGHFKILVGKYDIPVMSVNVYVVCVDLHRDF